MTTADDELRRDQAERDSLQGLISQVETANAVSTPGTRGGVLESILTGARARLATLEKKIQEAERKQEEEKRNEVATATLAQKETALSEKERQEYNGFLDEKYFTKKDFGKLEKFYAHAYDRLTEKGKEQMDYRVFEGLRRNEYTMSDLPQDVRDKTTARAYSALKNGDAPNSNVEAIPSAEKNKFLNAYAQGNKEEAERLLNQGEFKDNLATTPPSKDKEPGHADLDLSGVDLSKLKDLQGATSVPATDLASSNDAKATLSK